MKFKYIIIATIITITVALSGLLIFLSDRGEQKIGDMATFRKNLLQIEPSKRDKVFNFLDGKRLEKNLSFFFVCGGVLLAFTVVFSKFPLLGKILLLLIFGGISFLAYQNLSKINTLVHTREQIYKNGKTVTATVVLQSKKMVFYSSTPSYSVTVKTNDAQQKTMTFYFPSKMLHNSCQIGRIINGAEYNGDYFFGEMVGVNFAFANENGEIRTQN